MKPIKNVTIVGMGALGLLYGALIAEGAAGNVTFVMDEGRFDRHKNDSYTANGKPLRFSMKKASEASPADLVIVAVKYPDLAAAMDTIASSVGENTILLSVMNGIITEEILAGRFGKERVIHAVALGMDAMHFGTELIYSRAGQLCLGVLEPAMEEKLATVTAFLDRTSVTYAVEDILHRMWSKFMINVGINQTCMVFDTTYAGALTEGTVEYMTLIAAMREVILVANAEGICLSETDLTNNLAILRTLAPDATPSMGQDRISRRPSEVELFAGTMLRLGQKHGIPLPANQFLHRRVQEIEKNY